MKNKVIKKILMVSMIVTVSTGMPVVGWAADSKEETTESSNDVTKEDVIQITKDSVGAVIYDENDIKVTIQKLSHESNSGTPFFQIEYLIENNSEKDVTLIMLDSYVDDFNVGTYGGNTINAGKKGIADLSIWEKDYKPYNIDDFDVWESKIQIYNSDDMLLEKNMDIQREAFSVDSYTTENDTQEIDSEEEETKYNELQSQIDTLTAENKKLKKENKKLKKKVEKLENADQTTSTEGTESTTNDSDSTVENATQESSTVQEAVTEYSDSTTIKVVQQALNSAGYNCGTPDGVAGGKTTEAITKYETDKGITVNGVITDELLNSLNIADEVKAEAEKEAAKAEYDGNYTYDQLARNPDAYIGKSIKISGKVLQADTSGDLCYARIAMNSSYDTVIFVTYDKDLLSYRLLDDDMVTVYGTSLGVYSYEAVSGATITLPWLSANMIDLQ